MSEHDLETAALDLLDPIRGPRGVAADARDERTLELGSLGSDPPVGRFDAHVEAVEETREHLDRIGLCEQENRVVERVRGDDPHALIQVRAREEREATLYEPIREVLDRRLIEGREKSVGDDRVRADVRQRLAERRPVHLPRTHVEHVAASVRGKRVLGGPAPELVRKLVEDLLPPIEEMPLLLAAETRREVAQVRADAGAEVDETDRPLDGQRLAQVRDQPLRPRGVVGGLGESEPGERVHGAW